MKKIYRYLALILCAALMLAVAACSSSDNASKSSDQPGTASQAPGGSSNSPATSGSSGESSSPGGSTSGSGGGLTSARDTLNVAISGDTGNLDQVFGGFAGIIYQYYEGLINYKADGTIIWLLAEDIEEIGTTSWIIHCRKGVKFSNGNDFTAQDVWFTFDRVLSNPQSAFFLNTIDLEHSRIIDDYTLEIALNSYSVQQIGSLSQIYIKDAESFDEDDAVTNPIGTGPWIVEEYVVNSHVYLKANENYWGGKPVIDKLHYRVFNEDAQVINALQSGLVDIAAVPAQEIDFVKTLPDYTVHQFSNVFAATLSFNMSEDSVMYNLDARLAMCYALDRQAIANLAYFGSATVLNYPVSQNCRDFEPRLENMHPTYSVGRDLDLAKKYAEEAGIVGKDIVVITNGAPAYVTSAEILQACMKDIGVNVIINNYDGATYMDAQRDTTKWDMTLYAVASPQALAIGMLYEYILWGGDRYTGWPEHDYYMELGARGVGTPDPEARREILYEMSQLFVDAVPWYGICDQMASMAINKNLANVEILGSGVMRFLDWYWTA